MITTFPQPVLDTTAQVGDVEAALGLAVSSDTQGPQPYVIFDMDGTLACDHHRIHHLTVHPKEWTLYNSKCSQDKPLRHAILLFTLLLESGARLEIWTGRPHSRRPDTEAWLKQHIPAYDTQTVKLRMRPDSDTRDPLVLKQEWLDQEHQKPMLVFDDRLQNVQWFRSQGIPCYHVSDNDY